MKWKNTKNDTSDCLGRARPPCRCTLAGTTTYAPALRFTPYPHLHTSSIPAPPPPRYTGDSLLNQHVIVQLCKAGLKVCVCGGGTSGHWRSRVVRGSQACAVWLGRAQSAEEKVEGSCRRLIEIL